MTDKAESTPKAASQTEPKRLCRADTEQKGDWEVGRRRGSNGWATMRRCECRDDAEQLATTMNQDRQGSVFG